MLLRTVIRLLFALAALAVLPVGAQAAETVPVQETLQQAAQVPLQPQVQQAGLIPQTQQPQTQQPQARQPQQIRPARLAQQSRPARFSPHARLLRERRATVEVPIWNGSIAQGPQASYTRRVRSWSDMRFNGIVRQQTDFSCGAAALATIFNGAYGKRTGERQVLVNMLKIADPAVVKDKGFSLLDMKNYVKAIGMQGEGYSVPYDALKQLRVPGIVLMNVKGYKHFVVVRKATKDYVQIADPALGNRTLSRREFEQTWNGVVFVVLAKGYQADNELRNPPSPLAARRLIDHYSPVRNAEIDDFGIRASVFRF